MSLVLRAITQQQAPSASSPPSSSLRAITWLTCGLYSRFAQVHSSAGMVASLSLRSGMLPAESFARRTRRSNVQLSLASDLAALFKAFASSEAFHSSTHSCVTQLSVLRPSQSPSEGLKPPDVDTLQAAAVHRVVGPAALSSATPVCEPEASKATKERQCVLGSVSVSGRWERERSDSAEIFSLKRKHIRSNDRSC